ncbi:MAG: ABC transporter ATP-binding protein [Anaerolineales bacterium]
MSEWLIETQDLTKIYDEGAVVALKDVNIKIASGELVSIMGPSGSGKSTLLNMIGALDQPTEGKVIINGEDLSEIEDVDTFRAKMVGFVFQMHNLLPTLNARENVEIPMMGHAHAKERKERAEHLLGLVGLADRADHLPSQLSGGQRQRVAVARGLANNPPLVLADEPTGNLDTEAGRELILLLHELNETQGTTFIVVTHDAAVARQTNRVMAMKDGEIVREDIIGSPIEEDLKMWQHSGLGRRILAGEKKELEPLKISTQQIKAIKKLLDNHNQKS